MLKENSLGGQFSLENPRTAEWGEVFHMAFRSIKLQALQLPWYRMLLLKCPDNVRKTLPVLPRSCPQLYVPSSGSPGTFFFSWRGSQKIRCILPCKKDWSMHLPRKFSSFSSWTKLQDHRVVGLLNLLLCSSAVLECLSISRAKLRITWETGSSNA